MSSNMSSINKTFSKAGSHNSLHSNKLKVNNGSDEADQIQLELSVYASDESSHMEPRQGTASDLKESDSPNLASSEAIRKPSHLKTKDVGAVGEFSQYASTSSYNRRNSIIPQSNEDDEFFRNDISELDSASTNLLEDDDPVQYPEGGLQANLVVLGAFFGLLPSWGIANSVGVIQTYIAENQLANVPNSTISWVFSIFLFLMTSSSVLTGTYFDRNGAKYPMIIGSVFLIAGLIAVANATKLYQFILSFSVLCGLGSGIVMSPIIGVISHYFKRNRATAIGIATNGGSVGGVVFPLMLRKLYSDIGFMWSMRILALIGIVCMVISYLLVKERNFEDIIPRKVLKTKKEVANFYLSSSFDFKSVTKDFKFVLVTLGCVFAELNIFTSSTYFSFISLKSGFSQNQAFLFVTVTNAAAIFGRALTGVAADKWTGRFNTVIILLLLMSFFQLVVWMPFKTTEAAIYTYCCCYGFCYGSALSLLPAVCGQISRTTEFGKRYSTMYAIVGVAILCLVPVSAAIVGDGLDSKRVDGFIVFSSVLCLVGCACYCYARYLCYGFNLRKF